MRITSSDRTRRLAQYIGLSSEQLAQPLLDAYNQARGQGFPLHLAALPGEIYFSATIDATIAFSLRLCGFLDDVASAQLTQHILKQAVGDRGALAWEAGVESTNVWTSSLCTFALRSMGQELPRGAVEWLSSAQSRDGGWGYRRDDISKVLYTFYVLKGTGQSLDADRLNRARLFMFRTAADSSLPLFERVLAAGCLDKEARDALGSAKVSLLLEEFRSNVLDQSQKWLEEPEFYRSPSGHVIKGMRWALLPSLFALGFAASDPAALSVAEQLTQWVKYESWPSQHRSGYSDRSLPGSHAYALTLLTISSWVERLHSSSGSFLVSAGPQGSASFEEKPAFVPDLSAPLREMQIGEIRGKVHLGVICVREDEFAAVLRRFPVRQLVYGGANYYDYALVLSDRTELGIAICRCPEQGTLKAHTVASGMIGDLDPPWILLVGIAGCFPDADYTLGDVVIASRLADFSVTSALEGRPAELDVRGGPMHPDVQRLAAHLPALADRLPDWSSPSALKVIRPNETVGSRPGKNKYYGPVHWQRRVYESIAKNHGATAARQQPRVFAAANASGNTLVKDAQLAEQWKTAARGVATVEMELAGVYEAIHARGGDRRLLSIRGISDIVGYKRDSQWTAYACETAASFSHALVVSGLLWHR